MRGIYSSRTFLFVQVRRHPDITAEDGKYKKSHVNVVVRELLVILG